MARRLKKELRDLGCDIGPDGEITSERMEQTSRRFRAALQELADAWLSLPPLMKKRLGRPIITLEPYGEEE